MEVSMTKILLVEDDKSLREIYGVRLLAEGYEIVSAGDGEQALAMAVKERPDLIISDVMMPKISGFDMLDILRATPETKNLKVIMMTALSSEDQRARGESLGADRYLVKSQVGIEDVVRTVHDVLLDSPIAQNTANRTQPKFETANTAQPAAQAPAPVIEQPSAVNTSSEPTTQSATSSDLPQMTSVDQSASVSTPVQPSISEPVISQPAVAPVAAEFTQPLSQPQTAVQPTQPEEAPIIQPQPAFSTPDIAAAFQSQPVAPVAPVDAGPQPVAPQNEGFVAPTAPQVQPQPAQDIASMMNQELNSQPQSNDATPHI